MEHVERSTIIAAPPQVAFALISQPQSLCKLLPGHAALAAVEVLDASSWRCHWSRLFMDVHFEGWYMFTSDPSRRSVTMTATGGLVSNCLWALEPTDGGTRVTLHVDAQLPMPLMRKHALGDLREAIVRDAEQMLANLVALVSPEPAL